MTVVNYPAEYSTNLLGVAHCWSQTNYVAHFSAQDFIVLDLSTIGTPVRLQLTSNKSDHTVNSSECTKC